MYKRQLIIGDEILSGRTQDTNANFIARNLTSSGIKLEEIRVIQDSRKIIIDSIKLFSENITMFLLLEELVLPVMILLLKVWQRLLIKRMRLTLKPIIF